MHNNYFTTSDGVKIELIHEPYCEWCSKPIPKNGHFYICAECYAKPNLRPAIITHAVGLYMTDGSSTLKNEILALKTNPFIADRLGECMVHVLNERYEHLKEMDLIVSVPKGDPERNYDQAELLAKHVSMNVSIPYRNILYKKRNILLQHTIKTRKERQENVKDAIGCREQIEGKRILLIDDIYTDGSTKEECAKVLKNFGAMTIYGLVVGRVVDQMHMNYCKGY